MDAMVRVFAVLPLFDWLAIVAFAAGWAGYAWFARYRAGTHASILATTNRFRRLWMLQTTYRDVRVVDAVLIQNMATSPSFFASTTILIIGGLLAVLGADKANDLVRDIPFAARTSALVFELKLALMLMVFVYAFFRFTWSMRQYTFAGLLVASAPEATQYVERELSRDEFADKGGRVLGLAAETFNDGIRAYYFSFAALGWFFSPLLFLCATAGVIYVLYQREFKSEVLAALNA